MLSLLVQSTGLSRPPQNLLRQRTRFCRAIRQNIVHVIQVRRQCRPFLPRFGEIIPVTLEQRLFKSP